MAYPVSRVDRHEPFNLLVVALSLAAGLAFLLLG
jgi:hypothetical protein